MIFKQFFDDASSTYTYLLADENTLDAVIIDPVSDRIAEYTSLLEELNLTLIAALDTHVHADHVTALGLLGSKTNASTYLGTPGEVACADSALEEGQVISFGTLSLNVMYTPGHTDDSYCFLLKQKDDAFMLFSGDTLLIGGTGRTDFQNGSASNLYDSLNQKILTLPENTIVYPGHDYHGNTQSTIGNEKVNNERVKIKDKALFIEFMNNLDLPDPKQMDVAVPANKSCGKIHSINEK